MTDADRSAFRRENWDTYALARFVDCIKSGRVEPGSYLLVENLDRLPREDAGEATELFLSIVNKGVVVVQLSPIVMELGKPVNMRSLMFAIVELSRGHSESAAKSERVGAAWARKQREAAFRREARRVVSATFESPHKGHARAAQEDTGVAWSRTGEHFEDGMTADAKVLLRKYDCDPLDVLTRFLATLQRRLDGRGPVASGPAPWEEDGPGDTAP
jgi:hypothetical protein